MVKESYSFVTAQWSEDPSRVLGGKLSESSGYAGSDLYDYKAFRGDNSDAGSPRENNAAAESSSFPAEPVQIKDEQQNNHKKENEHLNNNAEVSTPSPIGESYKSMGKILLTMNPGQPLPVSGLELSTEKPSGKARGSSLSAKRSTFWGRSNGRKTPSMESVDSSGEEELAIQRLEIAKMIYNTGLQKRPEGTQFYKLAWREGSKLCMNVAWPSNKMDCFFNLYVSGFWKRWGSHVTR